MAVLVGRLPADELPRLRHAPAPTLGRHAATAVVHADPRIDDLDRGARQRWRGERGVPRRAESSGPGSNPVQLASGVAAGTISGVLIDSAQLALPFLNHGCTPLGPACSITARLGREIRSSRRHARRSTCSRPASGDLLRRDPSAAAAAVWVGEEGPSRNRVIERLARSIRRSRSIVLAQGLLRGDRLLVMRSDAASAQRHLRASLDELRRRLEGAPPGAVLYFTTRERGQRLFGPGTEEAATVQEVLGKVPLVGLVTVRRHL